MQDIRFIYSILSIGLVLTEVNTYFTTISHLIQNLVWLVVGGSGFECELGRAVQGLLGVYLNYWVQTHIKHRMLSWYLELQAT